MAKHNFQPGQRIQANMKYFTGKNEWHECTFTEIIHRGDIVKYCVKFDEKIGLIVAGVGYVLEAKNVKTLN